MDDLLKLVRTYRVTEGLAERLRLAEAIFLIIEPDLRLFVFGSVTLPAAEDLHQEILKAGATDLGKFQGTTSREFWAWSYRITRNKLNDHFPKNAADRTYLMPPEEVWRLVESSAQASPLSPEDRHDLKHALSLLTIAKPECHDSLWNDLIFGLDYVGIAEANDLTYDAVRMKFGRCLNVAEALVA